MHNVCINVVVGSSGAVKIVASKLLVIMDVIMKYSTVRCHLAAGRRCSTSGRFSVVNTLIDHGVFCVDESRSLVLFSALRACGVRLGLRLCLRCS